MTKRRQNHSCEQCRKSKKACDGYVINSDQNCSDKAFDLLLPCSYCFRTKKTCSLNPHWAQRHRPSTDHGLNDHEDSSLDDGQCQVKRQRVESGNNKIAPRDSLVQLLRASPQGTDVLSWGTFSAPSDPPSITDPGGATQEQHELERLESFGQINFVAPYDNHTAHQSLPSGLYSTTNPAMTDCGVDLSTINIQSFIPSFAQGNPLYPSPKSSASSQLAVSQHEPERGDEQCKVPINMQNHHAPSFSTFSANHLIMENSNRVLFSDSLLQIYHDVLENNLACWLAEDTCPYRLQRRRYDPTPTQQYSAPGTQTDPEWGITWSNRMYHRIRQLDRAAQSVGLIRLTTHENHASSRALNLAVMAFSTQCAQGKRRWNWFHEARRCENLMDHEGEELGDEFEQVLRQSIWEQARRALQDVSDVQCFRVVFAESIFGLVQKPCSGGHHDRDPPSRSATRNLSQSVATSVLPDVSDILAREGPPIFMARAARKIHALKYRFEAYQAGYQNGARNFGTEANAEVALGISEDDCQTIGLLYWLAVMFDTVSSSIHGRPVVVPDEECQLNAAQIAEKSHTKGPAMNVRWKLDLYAQDNTERPSRLHWPCPYEVATRAVARSAAVKVLLFRHVSYLQSCLRNRQNSAAIEEMIKTTLSVYRYWDITHGAFFRDLTMTYESVPPRIKSWFPCISIPWHLGSLILADLVDFVDENRLGCDGHRAKRLHVGLATKIRRAGSIELAELAAVITPQAPGTMGLKQLPDFHFAVNESPILTEPWPILLIRAFTNASIFHVREMEQLRNLPGFGMDYNNEVLQVSTARVESCVRALRFLGSKSRMAESIAMVLSNYLNVRGDVHEADLPLSEVHAV